jgi:hypothetical protein
MLPTSAAVLAGTVVVHQGHGHAAQVSNKLTTDHHGCNISNTSQATLPEGFERRKEQGILFYLYKCYLLGVTGIPGGAKMCHPKMPFAVLGLTYFKRRFSAVVFGSRREWQCRGHWNNVAFRTYKSGPSVSVYLRLSTNGDDRRRSRDL